MSIEDFNEASEAMLMMEAQDTLNLIMCHTWSSMSKKDREKMHKKLYRQAYPDTFKDRKSLSLSDVLGKV